MNFDWNVVQVVSINYAPADEVHRTSGSPASAIHCPVVSADNFRLRKRMNIFYFPKLQIIAKAT